MKKNSLALGFFDGIHKGHYEVLKFGENFAAKNGGIFYATTFTDEIAEHTAKNAEFLSTFDTRIENLKACGATPVVLPTESWFFDLSEQDFISFVIDKFSPSCIVCGENYRFGKNRSGDVDFLAKKLREKNIDFKAFPLYKNEHGETVSTSFVKSLIRKNDFISAKKLLIYDYCVKGTVERGTHTGTGMGFPTANISPEKKQFLPNIGVYAGFADTLDGEKQSIINVGCRPTFNDTEIKIECHYIDDTSGREYYGQKIGVHFVRKLRDTVKFADVNDLKKQLETDKRMAKEILRGVK